LLIFNNKFGYPCAWSLPTFVGLKAEKFACDLYLALSVIYTCSNFSCGGNSIFSKYISVTTGNIFIPLYSLYFLRGIIIVTGQIYLGLFFQLVFAATPREHFQPYQGISSPLFHCSSRVVLNTDCISVHIFSNIHWGADKSLARPGRKQLMFLSEWREFPSAPCLAKKNLMTARVSMLLKWRASLTCFRACFLPGRAKDLSAI